MKSVESTSHNDSVSITPGMGAAASGTGSYSYGCACNCNAFEQALCHWRRESAHLDEYERVRIARQIFSDLFAGVPLEGEERRAFDVLVRAINGGHHE